MSLLVGIHSSSTRRSVCYSVSKVYARFVSSMAPKGSNKDAERFIEYVNASPTRTSKPHPMLA